MRRHENIVDNDVVASDGAEAGGIPGIFDAVIGKRDQKPADIGRPGFLYHRAAEDNPGAMVDSAGKLPAVRKPVAVLMVDQAGWHLAKDRKTPDNITMMPLPSKSPELNPVENIWQFMRYNWLSNRIFTSYADILDHCCLAWNQLTEQPWKIMSIGLRDWVDQ